MSEVKKQQPWAQIHDYTVSVTQKAVKHRVIGLLRDGQPTLCHFQPTVLMPVPERIASANGPGIAQSRTTCTTECSQACIMENPEDQSLHYVQTCGAFRNTFRILNAEEVFKKKDKIIALP